MIKQTRKTGKEANAKGKMWIPVEDRAKVRNEGVGIQDYWLDCWQTDPFGNRWTLMCSGEDAAADIKSTTKAKYRKQLKAMGMFVFEERKDGKEKSLWVRNLRGSRSMSIEQILAENEQSLDSNEKTLDQIEQKEAETLGGKGLLTPSISSHKLLKSHTTTDAEIETKTLESVVVSSFDCDEEEEIPKSKDTPISANPLSGQLSEKSQIPVVQDASCDSKKKSPDKDLESRLSVREKDSAPPHVTLPQNDTLIEEFANWLKSSGREEHLGSLGGVLSLMRNTEEQVLSDAIASAKNRIDWIMNMGGFMRKAIDGQWKPQQPANNPEVAQKPTPTLPPLDKAEIPVMSEGDVWGSLPDATGKGDFCWAKLAKALRDRGLSAPEHLSIDVWGNRGQLSPIQDYFTSKSLDFEPIRPHLAGEYLIYDSDQLPVICFRHRATGEYQLAVVTR